MSLPSTSPDSQTEYMESGFESSEHDLCIDDVSIFDLDKNGTSHAALIGCLKQLQDCFYSGRNWDFGTTYFAALAGNADCLRYCVENGCQWTPETTNIAAYRGHIDCLRVCAEKGCPWDEDTMERVIGQHNHGIEGSLSEDGGLWIPDPFPNCSCEEWNIEVLGVCIDGGCPWHPKSTDIAAKRGCLDILRFCIEKGCPWDSGTTNTVVQCGNADIFRFCIDNGCPMCPGTAMMAEICKDYECFVLAIMNGCAIEKCESSMYSHFEAEGRPAVAVIYRYWRLFQTRRSFAVNRILSSRDVPMQVRWNMFTKFHPHISPR